MAFNPVCFSKESDAVHFTFWIVAVLKRISMKYTSMSSLLLNLQPLIEIVFVVKLQTLHKFHTGEEVLENLENLAHIAISVGEFISSSPSPQFNKHLMTGHKGNSELWFPETLNVPRGEAEGNIEVEGKQNSLFP